MADDVAIFGRWGDTGGGGGGGPKGTLTRACELRQKKPTILLAVSVPKMATEAD